MAARKARPKPTNASPAKRHAIAFARSHVTRRLNPKPIAWPNLWGRVVHWLLPWRVEEYPGVQRGVEELQAGRASWSAFKLWQAGLRTGPEWFATVLADLIEARCRAGLEIVRELRDYRAPVKRNSGALQVQADGRDLRGGRIGMRGGRLETRQAPGAGSLDSAAPPHPSPLDRDKSPCPKPSTKAEMDQ